MNFYKLIAKGYNGLHEEEQKIKLDIIEENLDIKNNDLLLDVGCGTGISSRFDCEVVGIDPSAELLQQNNIIEYLSSKIRARAELMPFKDNTFDKVISVTSIHNFQGIGEGLKEMKRVGKRDFAFSILKKTKFFNEIEKEINKNFNVKKIIDSKQDWVFICSKFFK
ncbi:MAG: class I SAM-dependent methyltransferase [Nanoarchaeota archaeon]|nr:class I SAM-dependent methyltransferase [Nanoarchaeota archaeon]